MSTPRADDIEREIRDVTIAITASEGWAKSYLDNPEDFKKLLALEADMEKLFRDYVRGLAKRVSSYVDWSKYHTDLVAVQASERPVKTLEAYDVSVLFDDDGFSDDEQTQIQSLVKDIYVNGISIGYVAQRFTATGNRNPHPPAIQNPIDATIQEAADEHVQQLAQWLDQATAHEVVQSIQESLALGENQELAMQRLMRVIDSPTRARRIAMTEAPRAFAIGESRFAVRNGAISKTWEALPGADANSSLTPCLDNDGTTVDILDSFPSGDDMNPAHPFCRCKVNYNYPDGTTVEDV